MKRPIPTKPILLLLFVLLLPAWLGLLLCRGIGFFAAGGSGPAVCTPDVGGIVGMALAAAFLVVLADWGCLLLRFFRGAGKGGFQVFDEVADGF